MSAAVPSARPSASSSLKDLEKDLGGDKVVVIREQETSASVGEIDLFTYHERNAGRLVIDPEEAKIEFGEDVAKRLKLSADGTKVLWPQPTDDPEDPQNWSDRRKNFQLFIITLAAIVPDFDSGIGIASIFQLAQTYNTTTGVINNLTSNWSIFLLGWGSIFAVMLMRRYGRLPILFWSQVLALGFLIGCTFAPNLNTFTAMRCLTAFFGTCPQVTGLYVVTDLYPFHLQARKLNIWTMGFIISPFLSPFAFGFLAARANWRWTYGIGSMYGGLVVFMITFFLEESMYDRSMPDPKPIPRPKSRLLYRIQNLVGITGWRMAKYRARWRTVVWACVDLVWRPHIFSILVFEALIFGFTTGINTTNAVILAEAPPKGYGFSEYAIAGAYGTPIVAVVLGEQIGHYLNDWIMEVCIRRNKGVFEAEMRLWACYAAVVLYIVGFVVLGACMEQLNVAGLVLGWGIAQCVVVFNTVAVCECQYTVSRHMLTSGKKIIAMLDNIVDVESIGSLRTPYFIAVYRLPAEIIAVCSATAN
ncbi:MFS general substrate transporter [Rhodofomes roseus]|uniref:MFS general substrate transporter n=1 Tax=Rhodofomes roseus TaxID=34475 RepID=A0ABQ8K2S9_9APHY|nr:MFS general substrate transporter [Rhodofomes roseus]KAH9831123.1 MFS general substrate transporter [Rhodofomes roseus]